MSLIKLKKEKGFTLIEAMVAILLLSMFLSASYAVAKNAFKASFIAGDRITAFYLAQEAIENVKTLRAYNRQNDNDWLSGLENCTTSWCVVDKFNSLSLKNVPEFRSCGLNFSSCTLSFDGVYDYNNSGSNTNFKRALKILDVTEIPGGEEVKVRVRVEWTSVGETYSSEYIDYLYDW